ncbi:MAG TPA: iron-containing redox enzyme family protein [Acidimicrobiales bacterium]
MTHDNPALNPQARLSAAVAATLEERMLLTHPFYRRWEAGELRTQELAEYAVHYRAFEAVLPTVLSAVVDRLMFDGEMEAADLVARNLADELGRPESHLAMFDEFASALPTAHAAAPGVAADALAGTYLELVGQSPVAAIAGLAAYETQAAAIAASKGDGLRRWYGVDADGTRFWDVHATMDVDHGDWVVEALAMLGADEAEVSDAARRAADAWWALLDEREAEGLATV